MHTTLVQSSLRTDNFGVTLSDRIVYSVDLAYELNSTEIVQNIWLPILKDKRNIDITDKSLVYKLTQLASTALKTPRIIQFIRDIFADTKKEFNLSKIFEQINVSVGVYYRACFPTGKYLEALINRRSIDNDAKSMNYIMTSIYVNMLNSVDFPRNDEYLKITPDASLALLYTAALKYPENDDAATKMKKSA